MDRRIAYVLIGLVIGLVCLCIARACDAAETAVIYNPGQPPQICTIHSTESGTSIVICH